MKPLLVLGPITKDTNYFKDRILETIGGANFYQSIVFEKLNVPYKMYVTLNKEDDWLLDLMPDKNNIIPLYTDETLSFVNKYTNDGSRVQFSNFAVNPIFSHDLDLNQEFSAIVLNPLVRTDFPLETIKNLYKLGLPIFLSIQGLLRYKLKDNKVGLSRDSSLVDVLKYVNTLFLDINEAKILNSDSLDNIFKEFSSYDLEEIIITQEKKGSIIYTYTLDKIFNINACKIKNIKYPTGAGDTYMASYIFKRLKNESIEESGNFASKIASKKIEEGLK